MCSSDKRFCFSAKHPDWLWGPGICLLSEYQVLLGLRVKWLEHESDCTRLNVELRLCPFRHLPSRRAQVQFYLHFGIIVHGASKKQK